MDTGGINECNDMFAFGEVYVRGVVFVGGIERSKVYFMAVKDGEEYIGACKRAYQCSWGSYPGPLIIKAVVVTDEQPNYDE